MWVVCLQIPTAGSTHTPSTSASSSRSGVLTPKIKLTYGHLEYSPFKQYLKISDSTIVKRKSTKFNSRTRSAITGDDYFHAMHESQEEKENILKGKELMKKECEDKKIQRVLQVNEKR